MCIGGLVARQPPPGASQRLQLLPEAAHVHEAPVQVVLLEGVGLREAAGVQVPEWRGVCFLGCSI